MGGSKRDAKNELVVILGLSHDGPGFRAIKVYDGEVITSADIKAQPALGTARSLIAKVATDHTAPEAAFVSKYCNTSDIHVDIADAERGPLAHMKDTARDTAAAATAPPPLVQQVAILLATDAHGFVWTPATCNTGCTSGWAAPWLSSSPPPGNAGAHTRRGHDSCAGA